MTDQEWDINNLKNTNGQATSREEVCQLIHQSGYQPFAVIVRPNNVDEQNNDFIEVRALYNRFDSIWLKPLERFLPKQGQQFQGL